MNPSAPRSDGKSPSSAVIEAVAERWGVTTTELPEQLYEVVDSDSLDSFFADGKTTDGTVTFTYCGDTVTEDSGVGIEDWGV